MTNMETEIVQSIENVSEGAWNNVVKQGDLGSVFHRYKWLKSFERSASLSTDDSEPRHIVIKKGGNPVGICPGFITSIHNVPFKKYDSSLSGFGGPVTVGDPEPILERIFDMIESICGGTTISHFMKPLSMKQMKYSRFLYNSGYRPNIRNCRFRVNLNRDIETIIGQMESNKRNKIRNIPSDVTVEELQLEQPNINLFTREYRKNMKRLGIEGIPSEQINALVSTIPGRLSLIQARKDGTNIGMFVYVLNDEQETIQHFLSAIDSSNFEHNPAECIHYKMIQQAQQQGYERYDFGGTAAHWKDGVFKFKSEFGGEIIPTIQWENGHSWPLWKMYKLARHRYLDHN